MQGYKDKIRQRLRGKPHLLPLYSNVYHIPERLRSYDDSIFVVFNTKKQRYEVHCLSNYGDTFAFLTPFKELDARTITFYHKTNLRTRGRKIFDEMEEHNEELRRRNERAKSNEQEAIAKDEVYPRLKKVAGDL